MKTTTANRPTLTSLEQRVAKQERAITTGVRVGTIDASEAKSMRAELGKVKRHFENDAFDGNGLSRREQASKELHGVAREIKGARGDENVDLAKRTADIDRRITQGVTDGSLTQAEGEALKATSSSVKAELAAATTPEAKQAVAAKVQELSKQVVTDRHDGERDIQKRVDDFASRITAGVADGSLTQREANRLTTRLGELPAMATAKEVNGLDRNIFHARHDAQTDVPQRTSAIEGRITSLEAAGKLTPDQVSSFRARLETLSAEGARAVGPRLNVLNAQLDAVA